MADSPNTIIVFICIHLWNCFWAFWKIIFHPRSLILILLEFSDFLWLQFHVPLGIWVDLVVVKVTRHHYKETRSSFRTLARNLVVVRTFSTSRCPFSLLILVWRTHCTESYLVRIVQHYFKIIGCIMPHFI